MTALTVLVFFATVTIVSWLWAIDVKLHAIRADLERIESALADIADAVGVDIVPEEDWPDIEDAIQDAIDDFAVGGPTP